MNTIISVPAALSDPLQRESRFSSFNLVQDEVDFSRFQLGLVFLQHQEAVVSTVVVVFPSDAVDVVAAEQDARHAGAQGRLGLDRDRHQRVALRVEERAASAARGASRLPEARRR
jgi:hypothetical protein